MSIDSRPHATGQIISNGELWFWNGRLVQNVGAGVTVNGLAHGDATFQVHDNGELDGRGDLAVDRFGASGARLSKPLELGDCSLKTIYSVSTERILLTGVQARMAAATVASGDLTLNDPFKDSAALVAHLSGAQIDLAALKARLETARAMGKPLAWLAAALVSGSITIEGATYQGALQDLGWSAAALASALQFSARLAAVSLKPPNVPALPALSQANAEISYAKGRVTLSQGSAALGRSSFQELSGDADFGSGARRVRYRLKGAGTLDIDELYSAALKLSPDLAARTAKHIDRLSGTAAVRITASGSFDTEAPAPPAKYLAKIDTSALTLSAKDLPQPIALVGGSVTLTPGNIELSRVMAAVAKPQVPGDVTVNGNLAFDAGKIRLRQIAVEMHQIDIQQWLPLIVDPDDIAARGPLGAPSRSCASPPALRAFAPTAA